MRKATRETVQAGDRFGQWITLEADGSATRHRRWMCQCDCGTRRSVRQDVLRNGVSTSCGCSRKPVRAGDKVGRLTVVEPAMPGEDGRSRWRCICSCGRESTVRTVQLSSGGTKSCGCYAREASAWRRGQLKTGPLSYRLAHKRVETKRGPASNYSCADCGDPAREWSYDNADPNESVQQIKHFLMRYSEDANHYEPRCIPCHRAHDGAAGFA